MPDKHDSESPYDFVPRSDPLSEPEKPPRAAPAEDVAPEAPLVERKCPHCGFRIVGKPPRGRCPECAAALDSVAIDLLQFADGTWLTTLSNGALLLAASVGLHVVAIVLTWTGRTQPGGFVHAAAGVIGAAGAWIATTPEPGAASAKAPFAPLVRLLAIAVAAFWIAAVFVPRSLLGETTPHKIAILLALACMAPAIIAVNLHLRRYAVRIPNDSLGRQLVNVGLLSGAMCVMLGVLKAFGIAVGSLEFLFICGIPAIAAMAAATLWLLWSLLRVALEVRNCAVAGQLIIARQEMRARAAAAKAAEGRK